MVLYYLYKPIRKKNFITRLCTCRLFNTSNAYIIALGILGVLLSAIDLYRLLRSGPILPCGLWRERIQPGRVISPESERDLKLVGLVFSVEYYGLLIYGIATKNPLYLLPILCFYAIIIVIEFFVFVLKIFPLDYCILPLPRG
ncbi:hypothetical protein QE152_g24555 [Popillia japonica]|uniref:Uncharacterized protein n=1 Tax=Popillia japonica TaxID=7064 RepID=A0AAW1KF11_POPJA